MQLHEFIKASEIAELPDDDPQEAFTQFVRIAQTRLSERIDTLSEHDDQRSWQLAMTQPKSLQRTSFELSARQKTQRTKLENV